MDKSEVQSILRDLNKIPSRYQGQHFIINKDIIQNIIEWADLSNDDIVLEIGAGIGALTHHLANIVNKVVEIEKDKRLVEYLKDEKELRYCEIATLLNRDHRTVYTIYNRVQTKRKYRK